MQIKTRMWCEEEKKYYYFVGVFNQRPYKEVSTFSQYESVKEYHELSEPELYSGFKDRNRREIYIGDRICQMFLAETISEEVIVDMKWIVERKEEGWELDTCLPDVIQLRHPERKE